MTATATAAPPTLAASTSARRRFTNNLATVLVTASFIVALIPLVWLLWTVISKGCTRSAATAGSPTASVTSRTRTPGGGAYHAILGTFEQVLLCSIISIPIGILVGDLPGRVRPRPLARAVHTFFVDVMTGIPSIVAGLFIFAVFVLDARLPAAGLRRWRSPWSILMIPVMVRSTEEMLKLVPNELREASYALGVPKWRTILRIVLPTAIAASSPASCWPSPASPARRPRC